jgi:methylmalonyl-CoA mutase
VAPKVQDILKGKSIVVVAGFPKAIVEELKEKGIHHFIHVKSNVLETLGKFLEMLSIN